MNKKIEINYKKMINLLQIYNKKYYEESDPAAIVMLFEAIS